MWTVALIVALTFSFGLWVNPHLKYSRSILAFVLVGIWVMM